MLLALSTGQRAQTLKALDLNSLFDDIDENKIAFTFDKILKTSWPGFSQAVEICAFTEENSICPLLCLQKYIEMSKTLRNSSQLFISFQKPYKAVTTQTISRWICNTLSKAGIDNSYRAHSTRSATPSKAAKCLDIDSMLKTVGWFKESAFARLYRRNTESVRKNFDSSALSQGLGWLHGLSISLYFYTM